MWPGELLAGGPFPRALAAGGQGGSPLECPSHRVPRMQENSRSPRLRDGAVPLVALILALTAGACSGGRAAHAAVDPGSPAGNERLSKALLLQTNRVRLEQGVAPLAPSEELSAAAQAHAEDMMARGFFAHLSPEGSEPIDRLRARAPRAIVLGLRENLSRTEGDGGLDTARRARRTVEGWLKSPGHRENLLSAEPTQVGFGVASRTVESVLVEYAVQLLGRVAGRWESPPPASTRVPAQWRARLHTPLEFFLEDQERPTEPYPDPKMPHTVWRGGVPLVVSSEGDAATVKLPRAKPGRYVLLVRRAGDEGYEPSVHVTIVR